MHVPSKLVRQEALPYQRWASSSCSYVACSVTQASGGGFHAFQAAQLQFAVQRGTVLHAHVHGLCVRPLDHVECRIRLQLGVSRSLWAR